MRPLLLLLALLSGLWVNTAFAGPPFQTDDPEPVDFQHYEFYIFGNTDGTPVETDYSAPAAEFNWGALPRLQLHAVLPLGAIMPSDNPLYLPGGTGPNAYGLIDTELGAKFEWVKETRHRPMIGTFTMLEVPTGSYAKGLGVGKAWYKLPVWLQKSWGPWTTYGGGGYEIVPQAQYRNFAYEGWLVQRDIGRKLTLGAEVVHHGVEGYATPQTQASTMVDVGGYYYFRNPGFQLLFAYGHSVYGQTENYAYLGLYWTWGGRGSKSLLGRLRR
jgi:hypothetical protein